MKEARAVTLVELNDWLEKNKKRTWHLMEGWKEGSTHEIKYLYPSFDTRDMKIFHIEAQPCDIHVNFRDEFNGTILDLLENKLNEHYSKSRLQKS